MKEFIVFIISVIIVYGGSLVPFGFTYLIYEMGIVTWPSKGGSLVPLIVAGIFMVLWNIWMLIGGKIMVQQFVILMLDENPDDWK